MQSKEAAQPRIESAKQDLAALLETFGRDYLSQTQNDPMNVDQVANQSSQTGQAESADHGTANIPSQNANEELSDIPAEMRETVVKEIQAFRDRSNKRDLERLQREEALETEEKMKYSESRFGVANANNIPLGPRGVQGAPTGPKGFQSSQPKQQEIPTGPGVYCYKGVWYKGQNEPDHDTDASDDELERRRVAKKEEEVERRFREQERRWLNREKHFAAALDREQQRKEEREAERQRRFEAAWKFHHEWNDDVEKERKTHEYYRDHEAWLRKRKAFRDREIAQDERNKDTEERRTRRTQETGAGDREVSGKHRQDEHEGSPREPRFKMSLAGAVQKAQQGKRGAIADVEGLLDDEEDADTAGKKRTLVPIDFDKVGPGMTEEERQQALHQLAAEIPSTAEGLWGWPVKWNHVDEAMITEQLRPFVEKKIVEYVGVLEEMLVDTVVENIKKHARPQDLVEELLGVSKYFTT